MTALTQPRTLVRNPYWAEVSGSVSWSEWDRGHTVGGMDNWDPMRGRFELTSRYSGTVTDPATVEFVAEQVGPHVIDPLAGSGYWAYLLGQLGADVLASDLNPPAPGSANQWHTEPRTWVPMRQADGASACRQWGVGRTLLLSWPPYSTPAGAQVVAAYPGDRIVYIGEGEWGCCGGNDMWELLARDWREVQAHRPVQWYGMHDWVTVYERVTRPAIGGAL